MHHYLCSFPFGLPMNDLTCIAKGLTQQPSIDYMEPDYDLQQGALMY